jgi:hypothetical protein
MPSTTAMLTSLTTTTGGYCPLSNGMSSPLIIKPSDVTFSSTPSTPSIENINSITSPNSGLNFPLEMQPTIIVTNNDQPETITTILIPSISNVETFTVVFQCECTIS